MSEHNLQATQHQTVGNSTAVPIGEPITPRQARVLNKIRKLLTAHPGRVSFRKIGQVCQLSPGRVSEHVDILVKRNYLTRVPYVPYSLEDTKAKVVLKPARQGAGA